MLTKEHLSWHENMHGPWLDMKPCMFSSNYKKAAGCSRSLIELARLQLVKLYICSCSVTNTCDLNNLFSNCLCAKWSQNSIYGHCVHFYSAIISIAAVRLGLQCTMVKSWNTAQKRCLFSPLVGLQKLVIDQWIRQCVGASQGNVQVLSLDAVSSFLHSPFQVILALPYIFLFQLNAFGNKSGLHQWSMEMNIKGDGAGMLALFGSQGMRAHGSSASPIICGGLSETGWPWWAGLLSRMND